MEDRNAGGFIIINSLLIFLIIFSYQIAVKNTVTMWTQQLQVVQGTAMTLAGAMLLSGFFILFRKSIKSGLDELKREIFDLSVDEFLVYKLLSRHSNMEAIKEKTHFSKKKIKKIIVGMKHKGAISFNEKGKMRTI